MSEQAASQVENIRRQIEQEKNNWANERQLLVEEAKQDGFEQGVELGKAEALQQYAGLINQANDIAKMSRKDLEDKLESASEEIVELAVALAKKSGSKKLITKRRSFCLSNKLSMK